MTENKTEDFLDDDFLFYSLLYASVTVVFAMAVLSKFLTNDLKLGFRSFLSLVVVFVGEPLCHLLLRGPSGIILFGVACATVYSMLPTGYMNAAGKSILVTGCDTGLGYAVAKELDRLGMIVYAGCLSKNGQQALQLKAECSERLVLVQMDVTNEQQVKEAHSVIEKSVGSEGLWGVVNNAGICYLSSIEMTSLKLFKRTLDINVLGVVCVTRTFLPLVRKAKGRIVNVTSVTGRMPFKYFGAYSVSKAALEMYSDVLRLETCRYGVHVSVIEPSAFKTNAVSPATIAGRKVEVWTTLDDATRSPINKTFLDRLYASLEASTSSYASDFSPVSLSVRNALFSKYPRARYAAGRGAGTLLTIYSVLPTWLADKLCSALSLPTDLPQ